MVLIHGLWMTGAELLPQSRRLSGQGLRAHLFHYSPTGGTPQEHARHLAAFVERKGPGPVGHATFLGAGAYTTMILYLKLGLAPWYGIVAGGVVAALIALPIGFICFRLRGPYFSLSTLAVAEIVRLVALNWESLTAGPVGLLITTLPEVSFLGTPVNWESKTPFYYIGLAIALAALLVTAVMFRTRMGAYLLAIREDIDSAEAIGINTVQVRVAGLSLYRRC